MVLLQNLKLQNLTYKMNMKSYKCSLHGQSFEFFCQRCVQPVCKQCTIIGPHHTQIHALTKISVAYQNLIQQVRHRIQQIVYINREKIFLIIIHLNNDIDQIDNIKKSIDFENNKQKQRMLLLLKRQYENNRNILHSYRQNLQSKINQINDLGYKYQNIQNFIQLLGSHQSILHQIKELHDRLIIMLVKQVPISTYTKQLTDIRIKLKQIQALNQLYQEKLKVLEIIMKKAKQLSKIKVEHNIDYQLLLKDLDNNLSSISHNVCHFCGVVFTFAQANKQCIKNNINIATILTSNGSDGYCKCIPDTSKLGTHRHYFNHPKNPLSYYSTKQQNSFSIQLNALLLKVKTLYIKKQFNSNDKNKTNQCEKIVFYYIFIQLVGINQAQADILLSLTKASANHHSLFSYQEILIELSKIDI